MQRRRLKNSKPIAEINVVPFIDVMLVLLVIFMVTAPLLTQGIKVQLPTTSSQTIKRNKPLTININRSGKIYANNNKSALTTAQLQQKIKQQLQANQKQQFLLRADGRVDYAIVAKTLSRMQQAGATKIGMVTTPSNR